ncbi:MAG: hypothetical protein GX053_15410 [Tissierella sp.]|nr:hypothetical protein [Tissierella sp.]
MTKSNMEKTTRAKRVETNTEKNLDAEVLLKENQMLKEKLDSLEDKFATLLGMFEQQSKSQSNSNNNANAQDEKEDMQDNLNIQIPRDYNVVITSLFTGKMTLKANNKRIPLPYFGSTMPVTYEDLTYIVANHRRLAEERAFVINDDNVVKALYLQDFYKNKIDANTLQNIISLPEDKLRSLYDSLSKILQESVIDLVIDKVKSGQLADRNKISIFSELSGKDIDEIIHLTTAK